MGAPAGPPQAQDPRLRRRARGPRSLDVVRTSRRVDCLLSWPPGTMTGMDWSTLAPTALGGLLALGGGFLGQWFSGRQSHGVWARDQRAAAHSAFLAEHHRLSHWMVMVTRVGGDDVKEPHADWTVPLVAALVQVELVGSAEVSKAGRELLRTTSKMREGTIDSFVADDEAAEVYRRAAQKDIGLKPTDLSSSWWTDRSNLIH